MKVLEDFPVLLDHVSGLLSDHNGRCVRISRNDRRHDRRVDHSKSTDAMHPQPRVHHRHFVRGWSHFASAARVINSHGVVTRVTTPIVQRRIRVRGTPWQFVRIRTSHQSLHRRCFRHFVDEIRPLCLSSQNSSGETFTALRKGADRSELQICNIFGFLKFGILKIEF